MAEATTADEKMAAELENTTPAAEDVTPAAEDTATPAAEDAPAAGNESKTSVEDVAKSLAALGMDAGLDIDPHEHLYSATTFRELNLPDPIHQALTVTLAYKRPFQIQATALPQIVQGRDIIAQAKTGSGKTVAFAVGMLLHMDPSLNQLQALCMTPSREVAVQIMERAIEPLTTFMPEIRKAMLLPGQPLAPVNAHIAVATPGKVKELLQKRLVNLSQLKVLVLDEADKMVSSLADTQTVLARVPATSQRLLFSATYNDDTMRLAKKVIRSRSNNGEKPVVLRLQTPQSQILAEIKQIWMDVRKAGGDRLELLKEMYASMELMQSIVFVNTRDDSEKVAKALSDEGYNVSYLHGKLEPQERDRLMQAFRDGSSKVLITTDVLSRGVDVESVTLVVNYHIPIAVDERHQRSPDPETYVHRIGRTGRAGRKGLAITFVANEADKSALRAIEKHYSPDEEMIAEWNPSDLEALEQVFKQRQRERLRAAAPSAAGEEKSSA